MEIVFVTPEQLSTFEKRCIALHCTSYPEFVMVQHSKSIVYINRNYKHAAELAEIAQELWPIDLLDDNGEKGLRLIEKAKSLSNPDAANMLRGIWNTQRGQRKKAEAEQAAKAWRQSISGLNPEEFSGYNCEFLRALYFTTHRTEENSPAQKFNVEHAFNKALAALFLYGYQCGQHNAPKGRI